VFVQQCQILLEHCQKLVAAVPKTNGRNTATAEQYNYNDCNDDSCVVLLGFSGGNGHFGHDFFSL